MNAIHDLDERASFVGSGAGLTHEVMTKPSLLTILFLLLTSACGAGQDKDASTPATSEATLEGHWVSPSCESMPGQGGSTTYFTRDFTLTKTDWTLAFRLFADGACTQKLGTIDIGGPYKVLGDSVAVAGAREAVFSFGRRTVTAEAKGFADFLGTTSCGTKPWAVGASQDLLAGGCAALGAYPIAQCASDNDVVKVEGDRLWFGQRPADNDMCSADKRPRALGTTPVVRK
jgi:hypothetical protein